MAHSALFCVFFFGRGKGRGGEDGPGLVYVCFFCVGLFVFFPVFLVWLSRGWGKVWPTWPWKRNPKCAWKVIFDFSLPKAENDWDFPIVLSQTNPTSPHLSCCSPRLVLLDFSASAAPRERAFDGLHQLEISRRRDASRGWPNGIPTSLTR